MKYQRNSQLFTLLFLFLVLVSTATTAQSNEIKYSHSDLVTLSDERIITLTERYNRSHEIHGYRVQIISSSKKEKAKKAKSIFASRYHGYQAHEMYQQPFFIIKVGDFLTKIEAENLHREIRNEFPESFVLPDIVDPIKQYSNKD